MSEVLKLVSKLKQDRSATADSLEQLSVIISTLSPDDIREIVRSSEIISTLLSSSERTASETVLRKILQALDPLEIATEHDRLVLRLLTAGSERTKSIALSCLESTARSLEGALRLANSSLLDPIIDIVGENSLRCATSSVKILTSLTQFEENVRIVLSPARVKIFKEMSYSNDIVRHRIFDFYVSVAKVSFQAFEHCVKANLFVDVETELDSSDVLLQLNALESLSELASTAHGFAYLDSKSVPLKLENMLKKWLSGEDALAALILPGVVKFFGRLCLADDAERVANACQDHPAFLLSVLTMLSSGDDSLVAVAIDTIEVLGSTAAGRAALATEIPNEGRDAFSRLGDLVRSGSAPFRIRALDAIGSALKYLSLVSEFVSELSFQWFLAVDSCPLPLVVSIMKQPFADLHLAGLRAMCCIASNKWGLQETFNCPGLLEYVLNRSTETCKEGRELKYEIVKTMAESPAVEMIFGSPTVIRLKTYVLEGPFFAVSQSTVAMEGSN
ncbi:26S proteasome non-ATPase regulatory subunit 5-like [Oscarella lobularis]|uniref:26S proteasome non-ATPase regulatory subunit 5-like n=1 Tax=Oscarella lobularis TaxID=121494 RepID=UPI0033130EF4